MIAVLGLSEEWNVVPLSGNMTQAHSLGEASAKNKGHGPETSRDADGQDRYSRHKAIPPVAEGNTSTSRGAKARPGRGGWRSIRVSGILRGLTVSLYALPVPPSSMAGGGICFSARQLAGRRGALRRKENVWTLVRVVVPDPTFVCCFYVCPRRSHGVIPA